MRILLLAFALVSFFNLDTAEAGKKKKKYIVKCPKKYSLVKKGKNKFVCRKLKKKGKAGREYDIDCGKGYKHEHHTGLDKCENTADGSEDHNPIEKCKVFNFTGNVGDLELSIDHKGKKKDVCVEKVASDGYKYKKPKLKKKK